MTQYVITTGGYMMLHPATISSDLPIVERIGRTIALVRQPGSSGLKVGKTPDRPMDAAAGLEDIRKCTRLNGII